MEYQLTLNWPDFLERHWQKRPVVLKRGFSNFIDPLSPDELAGLAMESEIDSRLVSHQDGKWQVSHGPFESYDHLGESNWSLLVQAVNHWHEPTAALMRPFRALPDWRIDDLMISFSVPGGGVGPHLDQYDVFIIQGTGRRRWRVGEKLQMRQHCPHPDLLQVDPFEAIIDEELEPGDILYIPPGFPHEGYALENAMNYSVGFRAPNSRELISGFADYVLQRELGNTYYSDPDMPSRKHPADILPQEMDKLRNMMLDLINQPAHFQQWLGEFLSQSRHELDIAPPEPPYQPDEIGPSGCGKTTVLRLIAGLETVDAGHIMLDNQDITHVPAENRYVNTVFQSYALFPHMTVFENVAFGLRMQKTPAAEIAPRVTDALRMVQLEEFAQRKPHQLSGGQQQRVAIARAVVNKPRLLLLDESLSALDYKLRKQMQNELKALQRKLGITFVFVTHDQEEALTMSDRIVVMRNGVIEQDGTPREIYEEPKNLFVAGFIGEINRFDATVIERLDEQRVRASVEGRECNIYVNFAVEPGQKLNVLLRPEDLRVEEINDDNHIEGLIGYVRERNYKGMTLESVVELENGKMVMVSEFFNEDDPDFDHSLDQKMAISWVESWEVVLADEEHK